MSETAADKALGGRPHAVHWWNSLLVRVLLLCCVLVLCLLGSVLILTRYFYLEAAQEMEARTNEIVQTLTLDFAENAGSRDLGAIEAELMERHEGFDVELAPFSGDAEPTSYTVTGLPDGSVTRVAEVPVMMGETPLLLTARVTIVPQVEIMRAFTNRYMLALTAVFLLALGMMLYFIARALRPLTRLTESCAAISSGNLQTVRTDRATGEIRALEATFNDMVLSLREKEMMEAKLRQAQRLSALGNLAAGVAHDVRNPLNAIKLLSSHALDSMEGAEQARAAKPLQTIRREVDRLEEIVSSFLSLARERELEPVPSRVDVLLEECVRLFQKDAEARGVRLIMD
jgi:signal transduction histidine kinase